MICWRSAKVPSGVMLIRDLAEPSCPSMISESISPTKLLLIGRSSQVGGKLKVHPQPSRGTTANGALQPVAEHAAYGRRCPIGDHADIDASVPLPGITGGIVRMSLRIIARPAPDTTETRRRLQDRDPTLPTSCQQRE